MTDDEFKAIQNKDGVNIVYPERRFLPAEEVSTWYGDAVDNGEIGEKHLGIPNTAWERQVRALDDAGLITVTVRE